MAGLQATPWSADQSHRALRARRWIRIGLGALAGMLAASIVLDHVRAGRVLGDDWGRFDRQSAVYVSAQNAQVIRVRVGQQNATTELRLLGVESYDADWDRRALAEIDRLLRGKQLALMLEPTQTRDAAGRLLANVFIDGQASASEELVRSGVALADRRMAYALSGQLSRAEAEARRRKMGLWADNGPERRSAGAGKSAPQPAVSDAD